VIDAEARWTGGTTTLVSVGDLVDRGPSSRKVLDLLMRLEREAAAAGGAVRVVLGNHEVMTLVGELRDASEEEVAEFAADERRDERAAAKARFVARRIAAGATEAEAQEAFTRRFPPGWFARRAAFAADGRYGAWLLSKPVAIVVDRSAFVHGGFSRLVAGQDLTALNHAFRARLAAQLADLAALERAALIDFSLRGEDRAEALALRLPPDPAAHASGVPPLAAPAQPAAIPPPLDAVAERVVRFDIDEPLFRMAGPVWYRGAAMCHAATEADVAIAAVARLGVDRIVVGHTPTTGARIRSRFDGKVVTIDTGMLKRVYDGQGAALEITAAGLVATYQDGTRSAIEPDPRPVALGPLAGDAPLLRALSTWTVALDERTAGERRAVELVDGAERIQAWFYPDHPKGGRHGREVAAYRLDRALGLGLVMPTVERNIGGVEGALQWRPTGAVTGAEAQRKPPQGTQWCDMPAQLDLMYAWDAVTLNEGRTLDSFAYTDDEWLLIASDHRRAFGERMARPGHLVGRALAVGPSLCRKLRALDARTLRAAAGTALTGKEQKALLARRDALVREAGCAR
jgi:hypothetical protein